MISAGRPDSVGGGVVADIFRHRNQGQEFFLPVTGGHDHSNHLHSGTLCLHLPQIWIFYEIHCRKKHLLDIFRNSLQKKYIYRKFGGGHGPPPWLRHWCGLRRSLTNRQNTQRFTSLKKELALPSTGSCLLSRLSST